MHLRISCLFPLRTGCSDGMLRLPIIKNSTVRNKLLGLEGHFRASSCWSFFHLRLQSSSDRASFPATVFQFGRALLSCLSWRSLARSAGVHPRGATDPIGEREREMLRAFAVLSRWLPVEWRRRSGAGLGAARSGDFDSVEFGIGTSSAAGAVQCRTG